MRKFQYLVDGDNPQGQAISGTRHYTLDEATQDAEALIEEGEASAVRIWKLDDNEQADFSADAFRLFLAPDNQAPEIRSGEGTTPQDSQADKWVQDQAQAQAEQDQARGPKVIEMKMTPEDLAQFRLMVAVRRVESYTKELSRLSSRFNRARVKATTPADLRGLYRTVEEMIVAAREDLDNLELLRKALLVLATGDNPDEPQV